MINKGNQSNQSRHLTLRIANIKFSVLHRAPRKKSTSNPFLQTPIKVQAVLEQDEGQGRRRAVSRNSFIPSTCIRSQVQADRSRPFINTPLFPADVTYSRFPFRPPRSVKPRNYFPIFRERIISGSPQRALNLSQQSFEAEGSRVKRNRVMHSRMATKSCLMLNQGEKEAFVRYSHINSQDCSEMKLNTERNEEENLRKTCL